MSSSSQLSEYFGVTSRLLPHVAELLADFTELGSDPELVVSWLAQSGVDGASRILDLGCGKGAVSIRACQVLGCEAHGVDAYLPFVTEANKQAAEAGIRALCKFQVGDIRETVESARGYDAVLFLSVGGVFGSLAECVGVLRRCVRPGGSIIIDDAYSLSEAALGFPGYEHLRGREDTLAQLVVHGDRLMAEHLVPLNVVQAQNSRYQAWIENRSRELAEREPTLADDIAACTEREQEECSLLERDVQCATWMLQRV